MASNGISLESRFSGALLGGLVGDVIGAAVEAESPGYIRKTFRSLDDILALKSVPEFITGEWEVGWFTDDTQMTLAVASWLTASKQLDGKSLLTKCVALYEPWRHYGSGTRLVLENFKDAREGWESLATTMFPKGSYGNGSAMRVSPIGLRFHNDLPAILRLARISSMVTHSHPLAVQGCALQAVAVATAVRGAAKPDEFLRVLRAALAHFEDLGQDTLVFRKALALMEQGIAGAVAPAMMVNMLGNGIKVQEAVPMAIYCFLANAGSFEKALQAAIFLGGDTDTIASMTGAIAGAALGEGAIPVRWLQRVTEKEYTPDRLREIAGQLYQQGKAQDFKLNVT